MKNLASLFAAKIKKIREDLLWNNKSYLANEDGVLYEYSNSGKKKIKDLEPDYKITKRIWEIK